MKKLKWVLVGLLVVVAAVLVTGYALLASFDVEQYREVIQAEVKKATGRDIRLDGPVDLRVSLTPAITVERVGLSNADWGSRPQMLSVERFEVEVALMPLLSGEVQVKRLVLVEPDILIETDAEGRSNLDFGTAAADGEESGAPSDFTISVNSVAIEQGKLTYRDGATGEETLVELDSLAADAAGFDAPLSLTMSGRSRGVDVAVQGSFGSFRALNEGPFPLDMTAEAAGATVEIKGSVAKPMANQGLDLAIAARGEQVGALSALAGTAVPPLGAYEASARLVQDGALFRLSDIAASLGASKLAGVLAVSMAGEAPQVTELDLALETSGESLADLNEVLGQELPALGPYAVSFRLLPAGESFTGEAFRIADLAASLGTSDLAGNLTIDIAGARPLISGQLTANKLDVAALAPESGGDGGGDGGGGTASDSPFVIPDDPLPLDGLGLVDAQLDLVAGQVLLPNKLSFTDLKLLAVVKDGTLSVQPLDAGFSGGQLGGGLTLGRSGSTPTLRLVLVGKNIDYGRLLKDQGLDDTVAGDMDFNLDVTGVGHSPRAIASSLNGGAAISRNEGVISNRLLKIVAVGLDDVLGPMFGGDQNAKLNCMLAEVVFKDGVATANPLVVDSEVFTISGGGLVDLRDESLDLSFDSETREASIASLAVPFNMTGTLKSPIVAPDPLGTALGVAKAAGMVINPVAGLGVLIGERILASGDDGNACAAALAEAPQESGGGGIVEGAGEVVGGAAEGAASAVEGVAEGAAEAVEGAVEGIGEGLKSLFGD